MEALPKATLRELDIAVALAGASERRGDFFPSRIAFDAAKAAANFPKALDGQLARGYRPRPAQTVEVPKWGGATRPAIDLAVTDRTVYDALVAFLRKRVVPGLVNESPSPQERHDVEGSLITGDHNFVLVTDISSFYEYVRHDILLEELLDLTGEAEAVEALSALLQETMQRSTGIPQGPPASGYLADVYASIADRHLARTGLSVVRISDDYRIPTGTWHEAVRAQLRLEQALRHIGLVINPGKTWTPSRDKYATWVPEQWVPVEGDETEDGRPDETEATTDDNFEPPYLAGDWGATEVLPLEPVDESATAMFQEIIGDAEYWGRPENANQSYRLTRLLPDVARMETTAPTDHLGVLLERYPHLTKEIAVLLRRRLGTTLEDGALRAIDEAIRNHTYLFDWQLGFLFHALIPATNELPPALMESAIAELHRPGAPWFSRGRAALVLATGHLLAATDEFVEIYEAAPAATRPDLLAGIVSARGQKKADELIRSESRDVILAQVPEIVDAQERFKW